MSGYYDPDNDARPQSPPLQQVRPKATPSPSPPPFVTPQPPRPSTCRNVSSPSSRRRRKPNRRKTRPSQGDFVLIRVMEPNRPDIARLVGERALNSDSGSEVDDDDMDDRSETAEPPEISPAPSSLPVPDPSVLNLQATAQKALDSGTRPAKYPPLFHHRDSAVEIDIQPQASLEADGHASQASSREALTNGVTASPNGVDSMAGPNHSSKPDPTSPNLSKQHVSPAKAFSPEDSLATSPNLGQLTIPQSRGSPSQTLPALQTPQSPSRDGPAGSPNQDRRLPSFRHLSELAETAINEQETHRANGFPHRPSISSSTHSPTSVARQLSISSARSPGSAFPPLSASSPSGVNGESTSASRDLFLRSGQSHLTLFSTRRPSQASDNSPYSATLHSASTTSDSYHGSDSLSPGSQPTPIEGHGHRMSIDEALTSRTLPPPNLPHIPHIPPHGSGGFKCEYAGCTAPPFQTQYLLNSHANVHSQSRPHYCPVADCPRGEGGKGFKRKNEMIRHGLVHASPGYVCPFCPDREHKYPRPDNLQRHVRVHHVDKDKDDKQLREVLAQRPEGGSRGRRRRTSS